MPLCRSFPSAGISYHGSPIVEAAGERYLDDSKHGGQGVLHRLLLLLGDDVDASTRESAKQLAGSFADVLETRSAPRSGITLVCPDGYVAYLTHKLDGAALRSVQEVLQRQTQPATSSQHAAHSA